MRNFKKLAVLGGLSAAVACGGLAGCETHEHHHSEYSERSEGRVVDDHRITDQVRDELRDEPVYKFNDIDVRTFDGVVQLSGFVNSDDQKRRAGEIAQHVPGVAQVVNNITLKPNMAPTPTGR